MEQQKHERVTIVKEWQSGGVSYKVAYIKLITDADAKRMGLSADDVLATGHHCGYATISGMLPDEDMLNQVDVHGGITYSEQHQDGTFTVGFDCAHYQDVITEWNVDRVVEECVRMAEQLTNPTPGGAS